MTTASARRELDFVASSLMPNTWQPLMAVTQLTMVILSWLSVSLEVFIRRDFGERYLNWLRLFLGYIAMDLFTLIPTLIFSLIPFMARQYLPVSSYFSYGFLILGAYHQFRIWQRNRRGIQWHSQSFGISRLAFLPISDWVLYRFVEPGGCFLVGFLIRQFDPVTGFWLMMASIALFIKNQMVYAALRGRFLDIMDSRIESAAMQGLMQGKSKRESAGFSVVAPPMMDFLAGDAEETIDIAATVSETLDPESVSSREQISQEESVGDDTFLTIADASDMRFDLTPEPETSMEPPVETVASPGANGALHRTLSKSEALALTLEILQAAPQATLREIGEQIGRRESTVSGYLEEMVQAGRLRRTNTGWEVLADPNYA
jgi:hypothetical protein